MEEFVIAEFVQYSVLGIICVVLGKTFLEDRKENKQERQEDKELFFKELSDTRSDFREEMKQTRAVYIDSINSVVSRLEVMEVKQGNIEADLEEIKHDIKEAKK